MADLPTSTSWAPEIQGLPGKSAYEIAVDEGFLGSEAQWLATLVGPTGATGPQGPQGIPGNDGADGADGVVQSIVAGTNVIVDATDPANPIISASGGGGGGGFNIASSLASGDLYLTNPSASLWTGASVLTTSLHFQMLYVDSDITASGLAINVGTQAAGSSVNISIYSLAGAGKPGALIRTAVLTTDSTGLKTASFSGGNVLLSPGVYFATVRALVGSPTINAALSTNEWSGMDITLLTTDGFAANLGLITERNAVTVSDANLPGGAWSSGMDLSTLVMSAANVSYSTSHFRIALIKA